MKFFKKAFVIAAAAFMIAAMPVIEARADEDLTIITNINKDQEIPLTLDASTVDFYVNENLNPGDVKTASVVFKNVSNKEIQVRISDVTDQLKTTMSQKLLETLDLSIEVDGAPVYKGKHDKVTSPLTQWITLKPEGTMNMKIRIELSKYDADNTLQGAEMRVKYVFEARADVKLNDSSYNRSETIKTGVDDVESTNPAAIALIIVAVVMIGGFLVYTIVSKKKKNDKE